jgi:hypothetical protein
MGRGTKTMASVRVITIVKESDHKSRYSTNECQVTVDDKGGRNQCRAHFRDGTLKLEQLQDRLIASGADPDLVCEFRDAVSEESFQNGIEAGQGSV